MATLGGFCYMMNSRTTLVKRLNSNFIPEIKICLENIWLNCVNWKNLNDDGFLDKNLVELPHLSMTNAESFKEGILMIKSAVDDYKPAGTAEETFQILGFKKTISHNLSCILNILNRKSEG